ncbi:hypothetical protein [Zooshikella ganghwensis]|uniref:Adenylosuccinate synthase n=1 Tax=Zooshikella ganghwensis TaxID=202772 RepID=A0A4P9VIU7_9GAMM|nr:hypothetical protein [Zooshikella ganghwensis]RDH41612.1 hypothetical protein B9G39_27505 [Zooshikella ganghwensis]RDH41702.1 hypothetical protein B9G39_26960 [Zooshikella ganghwensis]
MISHSHTTLCQLAKRWLLKTVGCSVAFAELKTNSLTQEEPDAIGWIRGGRDSFLIEVKVSRADFHADRKKFFRKHPEFGVGKFRYFMTPPNLLSIDDLPPGWGLLEAQNKRVRVIHGQHPKKQQLAEFIFQPNTQAELAMQTSLLRRTSMRVGDLQELTATHINDYFIKLNELKREIREIEHQKNADQSHLVAMGVGCEY